jgi:deoxyribodipyrimidine photo-lyase
LFHALQSGLPALPLFIFDTEIISGLLPDDRRVEFIYQEIEKLKAVFESKGSTLLVRIGKPEQVFKEVFAAYDVGAVYAGVDYEPYSISRDLKVRELCKTIGAGFHGYNDHVVMSPDQILKPDKAPYHIFTPFSRKWIQKFELSSESNFPAEDFPGNLAAHDPVDLPDADFLNIKHRHTLFPSADFPEHLIANYDKTRDYPAMEGTSRLGIHLRFGTVSIRKLARLALRLNSVFLNELIWREFYQMILFHYPEVVTRSFRPGYDRLKWLNDPADFKAWCEGRTGYPLVDAGMRQLIQTGFMHNRVRMVTASFLTKHLLIDWRLGEAFFAQNLLDYELASNNGGWQWAAGSGCDAVPYFRVFSPQRQQETFDASFAYIKKWLPEFNSPGSYQKPIVEHNFARARAIEFLRQAQK